MYIRNRGDGGCEQHASSKVCPQGLPLLFPPQRVMGAGGPHDELFLVWPRISPQELLSTQKSTMAGHRQSRRVAGCFCLRKMGTWTVNAPKQIKSCLFQLYGCAEIAGAKGHLGAVVSSGTPSPVSRLSSGPSAVHRFHQMSMRFLKGFYMVLHFWYDLF